MRSRKGEIPVYLMLSIVITIAGISLLLFYVGKNSGLGKRLYCRSLYDPGKKTDPFCEEYLSLGTGSVYLRSGSQNTFTTNRMQEHINMSSDNSYSGRLYIRLPANASVSRASLDVDLAKMSVTSFDGGRIKEVIIMPLNRPTLTKSTELIPLNTKILSARMEISGVQYPSRANLVFAIDTSSSMNNEWTALCSVLYQINRSLSKMGLNVTTDIFGLGGGTTFGDCITGWVTRDNMNSLPGTPLTTIQAYAGVIPPPYPPYDDYNEAWGLGAAWLADNYGWNYDTDVKRILIPIGDSDPTGGGPTEFSNGQWTNVGQFTIGAATETNALNLALQNAMDPPLEWVYVIPIYGDEQGNSEGYHVGAWQCTDSANTDPEYNNCRTIIAWMRQLAADTGASSAGAVVSGFRDVNLLLKTILSVIITSYPSDIDISVDGEPIWSFSGSLNDGNSPQVVSSPKFSQIIQDRCVGMQCEIGVTSNDGTVVFDRLRIDYIQDPQLSYIEVGSERLYDRATAPPGARLELNNPLISLELADALNLALDDPALCPTNLDYCSIPVELVGGREGAILAHDLNITYTYYRLEQDLFEEILECWKQAGRGQSKKSFLCSEISVPETYRFRYTISETLLTKMIMENNFCHIIGNNMIQAIPANCGDEDRLEFAQDIYNTANILIEYNGEKIIVS